MINYMFIIISMVGFVQFEQLILQFGFGGQNQQQPAHGTMAQHGTVALRAALGCWLITMRTCWENCNDINIFIKIYACLEHLRFKIVSWCLMIANDIKCESAKKLPIASVGLVFSPLCQMARGGFAFRRWKTAMDLQVVWTVSLCLDHPSTWWACHGQYGFVWQHLAQPNVEARRRKLPWFDLWPQQLRYESKHQTSTAIVQRDLKRCLKRLKIRIFKLRSTCHGYWVGRVSVLTASLLHKPISTSWGKQLFTRSLSRPHPEHSSKLPWLSGWFSAEPWLRWNVGNHVSNLNIVAFCEDIVQICAISAVSQGACPFLVTSPICQLYIIIPYPYPFISNLPKGLDHLPR